MVRPVISIDGHIDLYIIRSDNFTTQKYGDEILKPQIISNAAAFGDSFLSMQDNTRSRVALFVENFLEAESIQCTK
ncbi:hypothetical protein TNCV_3239401 [Trichonephila clavipes]|nr:hypothetical protein TNCV_3239401 [Trichonephila clavipes]